MSSFSPVLTQAVMHIGAGTSSSATLIHTPKTFFRQSAAFVVDIYGAVPAGTPTGNVVLLDGDRQVGPLLTLTSDPSGVFSACVYDTPMPPGTHQVRAVYLGDANFNGSISNVGIVNASPRPKPR